MAAITQVAAALVKPLEGAVLRRIQLGNTITAPGPVTLQSDGKWDQHRYVGGPIDHRYTIKERR